VDLFFSTGIVKKANRGEGEFRVSDEKSGRRSGISPGPDSSIISLIFNSKIF
jgi:hypothetical protein